MISSVSQFPLLIFKLAIRPTNLWNNDMQFVTFEFNLLFRDVHPSPKSMIHTAYSPLISTKFINYPYFMKIHKFPLFSFNLRLLLNLLFCFPLFWSWCICASCFTRTGRPCSCLLWFTRSGYVSFLRVCPYPFSFCGFCCWQTVFIVFK